MEERVAVIFFTLMASLAFFILGWGEMKKQAANGTAKKHPDFVYLAILVTAIIVAVMLIKTIFDKYPPLLEIAGVFLIFSSFEIGFIAAKWHLRAA